MLQVEVALVEDILLVVVSIIRAEAIMNGISLELPTLPVPIIMGFSILMEFGWLL